MTDSPRRVAVLGGGCGAMAAAFALTSTPELRSRYRVTVYQQGWRLGGKGASGRNAAKARRIEEHGLHEWLGFYENAFRVMRECYAEWQPPPDCPFQGFEDAFEPQSRITIAEPPGESGGPDWKFWSIEFPPLPGEPGVAGRDPFHAELFERLLEWVERQVAELLRHRVRTGIFSRLVGGVLRFIRRPPSLLGVLDEVRRLPLALVDRKPDHHLGILSGIERFADSFFDDIERRVELNDGTRRLLLMIEIGIAVARGFATEVLPYGERGYERIDRYDFKEWLMRHGASERTAWSPPVRAFYDLAFAYRDGVHDERHARVAAGAALKSILHMGLGYKDSFLFKMCAGMGDTIFMPLYEVLRARGVRFEFFHRVKGLSVSGDGKNVEGVRVARQAWLEGGDPAAEYAPLVPVEGLPCWPSEPRWEQLEDGERLRREGVDFESAWCNEQVEERTLERGRDFDDVVLGISVGALRELCGELMHANPRFAEMLDDSNTVQTLSTQLWMKPRTEALGWKAGTTVMCVYEPPYASWGEMSHLLPMEAWPVAGFPRSLQYLCGVLPQEGPLPPTSGPGADPDFPRKQSERVHRLGIEWLRRNVRPLWPEAAEPGSPGLDWNRLVDFQEREGEKRYDFQYWRANIDPSERYVLTLPGTTKSRLEPGDSGFDNLVLAGDWTKTRFNGGFVEAAVDGGLLAARALCGHPRTLAGYDDP